MKRILLSLTVLSTLMFVACDDSKKDEESGDKKEEKVEVKELSVDTEASYIEWKSWNKNAPEKHFHTGKVKLASGSVSVQGDVVTGGIATINIMSIFDTDLDSTGTSNLIGHLTTADFFAVDSLGAPAFTVTGHENGMIKGQLTIAGNTADVEVPAEVTVDENGVTITSGTFTLDMTKYNMPYFSQDKDMSQENVVILNPEVEYTIHIVAK